MRKVAHAPLARIAKPHDQRAAIISGSARAIVEGWHTVRSGSCMEWQKGTKKQKHRKSERLSNQVLAKAQQYPAAGSPIVSN